MTLPLTMNGRLEECLLMSYRTPARTVRHLLPRGLELLTRDGFAFWSVVACRVEAMRFTGVPRSLGAGYRQVAYRLHVRARTAAGETLDGLYFVRSDADSAFVSQFGNLLTDFRFHRSEVELSHATHDLADVTTLAIQSHDGAAADALVRVATLDAQAPDPRRAPDSPFATAAEADRFLRYRPLGLSVDVDARYLRLAEVLRDESKWRERPVRVIEAHWKFFDALGQDDLRLERATRVDPIDYRWRLGRRAALAAPPRPAPTVRRPVTPARAAA